MEVITCLKNLAPFIAMVTVEIADVGMQTLSKAAMTQGMNNYVFVFYYNALGTIILFPVVILRWKSVYLTLSLLCRYFVLGLLGSMGQMLGFTGIKFSSPTLSSATGNLVPVFTILLAVIFRIEKIDIRNSSGLAIILGALVSVAGAFVVTLYTGPEFILATIPVDINRLFLNTNDSNWIFGSFLLTVTWITTSLCKIFQTTTIKEFPDKIVFTFFFILFSTILCAIFSVAMVRDPQVWLLKADIEIMAVIFNAILGLVVRTFIHVWCLQVRGPVFVTMFQPLGTAIAMAMGVVFLGDSLYLGRISGAIGIAIGFYAVMWGKAKQHNLVEESGVLPIEACSQRSPLLQKCSKEEIEE